MGVSHSITGEGSRNTTHYKILPSALMPEVRHMETSLKRQGSRPVPCFELMIISEKSRSEQWNC